MFHGTKSRLATIGLALSIIIGAALQSSADPTGATGEWRVTGVHSTRGAYAGKVRIDVAQDKTARLSADLVVVATGEKLAWRGDGKQKGSKLRFDFNLSSPGLAGGVTGSGATLACHGTYKVASDGKSIRGTWRAEDGSASGTDTLARLATEPTPAPTPASTATLVAIVNPDGKEVREECLAVNQDDDDGDGGAGHDGETTIRGDKDDQDGVANEDDLLPLRVKPMAGVSGAQIKVEFGARLAVWKTKQKSPGTRVESGAALANAEATLYVEGLSPSDAGAGETVTAKLMVAGATSAQDSVTFMVSRSAFHLAGHGAGGASVTEQWLQKARRDRRRQPSFVEGKDEQTKKRVFWAVYVCQDEKSAKIGLGCENAVVTYDGHSNFGMGFAFETEFKRLSQFLNIADAQVPVNWPYLREHQEHPDLEFEDSEYADDASTPEFSDPIRVSRMVPGKLGSYPTARYPESGTGERLHLKRGPKRYEDSHYGSGEGARIVVKAGSRDMPVKKWSKIYLHSCYSGQYYSDSFGGRGSLFYTHDEAHAWSQALPAFIRSCIEGKTDDEILKAINAEENLNDYVRFGQ